MRVEPKSEIERTLDRVAGELDWLAPPPVFLGGATIGLFLDDFGRAQLRPTHDIDCIVPEVITRVGWWRLEEKLRQRGWSPAKGGPICRYQSPNGALVDLMPEAPEALGFTGRWYSLAVRGALRSELFTGRFILVPAPEILLACKLEAWQDRGREDPLLSQDLEDVVSLLDGCRELDERVAGASEYLQRWLAEVFAEILDHPDMLDAVLAQLPRGGDEPSREGLLLKRIARLARRASSD